MIDQIALQKQIEIFKNRLAPHQNQRDAIELAAKETMQKLVAESYSTGHPLERVFLVAMCGEIRTKQQQAEFATRLILLDLMLSKH